MITPEQARKEEADRELAYRELSRFINYTFPAYDRGAKLGKLEIHDTIIEKLEAVERGEIKRLMVFCPPRMGKSELISKQFPAWYLGRNPDKKVVCCSYSAVLAEQFGRLTRDIVKEQDYANVFPEMKMKKDSGPNWELTQGGGYYSVGVGGALTGKGYDLGIIDDPVKNREDAESETYRQKIKSWYTSTFFTRRMDAHASIIVMCTRWHEDDLAGWLLERVEETGEEREILKIPAETAEDGYITWDLKGWDENYWDITRKTVGEYDWNSLYMQEPYTPTEGIFTQDMFEYYERHEIYDENGKYKIPLQIATFVDPAISQKQTADYTAIVTVGIDKRSNNAYVLNVFRGRVKPDQMYDELFKIIEQYKPNIVGVENVAFQKMLILELEKQMRIRNTFFRLEAIRPMGAKEARISSTLSGRYSSHSVIHPRREKNINELESELLKFPSGKHDDIIDALSGAVSMLRTKKRGTSGKSFVQRVVGVF